jgi:hypothetical protein
MDSNRYFYRKSKNNSMKKHLFVLSLLAGVCSTGFAQDATAPSSQEGTLVKEMSGIKPTPLEVKFMGFSNPVSSLEAEWQPTMVNISKNESEDEEMLERVKEQKTALKMSRDFQRQHPEVAAKTTAVDTPFLGTNFAGLSNGGANTPLDNTVAISDSDYIVAFVNSKVGYFNTSGTLTSSKSMYSLINISTIVNNVCDPKVIYDNVAKRFIFFAQTCDQVAANSKVIIGFSKHQNPALGWYVNVISGNPYNDGSYFDYPKMAVSKDELFITGNLFKASTNGFNKCVVYQIPTAPGYAGTSITTATKYTIPWAFTITPAGKGQTGGYGPGIYMVSSAGSSTSSLIRLHQITNNVASGSAVLNTYDITTTSYSAAGNAPQKGSTIPLNTGDSRGQDAFYLNGFVHFVHHIDAGSGYSGISYHRINVAAKTTTRSVFKVSGTDITYPAVVSASSDSTNKAVLIAFNQVSSTMYPRTCAVVCDHSMNWSAITQVKAGAGYVHYSWSTTSSDRWGDYTGLCKKFNDPSGSAWMAGMYGNTGHTWSQWIAKIAPGEIASEVATVENVETKARVFPNPVTDFCNIQFELDSRQKIAINITDMQGKVVVELYNEITEKGEKQFSFNRANLAPGVYVVNITGETTKIKNERIVISAR